MKKHTKSHRVYLQIKVCCTNWTPSLSNDKIRAVNRWFLFSLASLFASLLLAGCGGPIGHVPEESQQTQSAPEAQPTPISAAPLPTPTPPPLAPPGTFFLLQRTAVMTSQGIQAYPSGTTVREVAPGLYDIKGELQELEPHQVTNNLETISELLVKQRAQVHAAHQARIRAAQRKNEPLPTPEPELPQSMPPAVVQQPPPAQNPVAQSPPTQPATVQQNPIDAAASLGAPLKSQPTPEEKVATRTYDTESGMRYHIRVRGAEVQDE